MIFAGRAGRGYWDGMRDDNVTAVREFIDAAGGALERIGRATAVAAAEDHGAAFGGGPDQAVVALDGR